MDFVCPLCKGALLREPDAYECTPCERSFPIVCSIPDFRVAPDPYIGIEADREKGRHLEVAGRTRSFHQMLDYYYAITPEDPPDLAVGWTAHALAAPEIAAAILGDRRGQSLLDVGCATGGMLHAGAKNFTRVAGVDVAFRWLIVAQVGLRERGVHALLVCANAEALPFAAQSFDWITCIDVMEHLRDPHLAASEFHRVAPRLLCVSNNRYAPLPDPHVGMFGLGYLPRAWQPGYVAWRRKDLHRYNVRMLGARELKTVLKRAGYAGAIVSAARLFAPHRPGLAATLAVYNKLATALNPVLRYISPKIEAIAES